jgi:hypothetical protein
MAVGNQNITLSLPEEDIREARILAASRGTSVSQLLARMLRELVEKETGYVRARQRSLARRSSGPRACRRRNRRRSNRKQAPMPP